MNHFDTVAADWDSKPHRIEFVRQIGEVILKTGRLTPETRLLDYGCGTGLLGLYLLPHVKHITGIDTSAGMLEVVREKIARNSIPNMDVELLDLQDPAARLSSTHAFEAVTMNMVMHHVEDTATLLKNLKQLLAPGGVLLATDLDSEPGTFHRGKDGGAFHNGFDRQELTDQLTAAGFHAIQFVTAHTLEREHDDGTTGHYDVFLATAEV
jgi:2-polyprenyl-3-methyl-5-hydroxy-6-metoxy-1,4-benzoquinol methylase